MNAPTATQWIDANQRLMVAEFGRLKQRLGAEGEGEIDCRRAGIGPRLSCPPRPRSIISRTASASAHSSATCCSCAPGWRWTRNSPRNARWPPANRADRAPPSVWHWRRWITPHWSALAPVSPLRRWRLVEVDESAGLTRGRLRIDERILHYLAGVNYLDVRLRGLLRRPRRRLPWPTRIARSPTTCAAPSKWQRRTRHSCG